MVRSELWNWISGGRLGFLAVAVVAVVAACGTATPDGQSAPAAAPMVAADALRPVERHPVALFAEGTGDPGWVLPPAVPPLPPGVEFRARYTYPYGGDDDVLEIQVFLTGVGAPVGLPVAPDFLVSRLLVKVDRFQVSRTPEPNLLVTGTVKSTPKVSPFGETVGRLVAVSAGFTEGDTTTFVRMGGSVSGSHVTVLPFATGSIRFARDR